ncbi:hypothetical protein BS17DRAFT_769264 [Gyrodon lividus]|nr:hypothetical protein BS17DRAFT_769264 [Gyrodon lividus]
MTYLSRTTSHVNVVQMPRESLRQQLLSGFQTVRFQIGLLRHSEILEQVVLESLISFDSDSSGSNDISHLHSSPVKVDYALTQLCYMCNKQTQFVATPMLTYTMGCFSSTRMTTTTLQLIDQISATPPPETNLGGVEVLVKKSKLASAEVLAKKTEEKEFIAMT